MLIRNSAGWPPLIGASFSSVKVGITSFTNLLEANFFNITRSVKLDAIVDLEALHLIVIVLVVEQAVRVLAPGHRF